MANPAILPDSVFDEAQPDNSAPAILPDSVFDDPSSAPAQGAANAQYDLAPNSLSLPDINFAEQLKTLAKLPSDAIAGLAQFGHGLLNTPKNIVSSLSPSLGALVPSQQDYNFSELAGNPNPTTADKLLQGGAQYLPYALGGEVALAGRVPSLLSSLGASSAASALFGLTQSNTPFTSAAEGAGLNAATSLLGAGAGAAPNAIKNYLSKSSGQGIGNLIDSALNPAKSVTNDMAVRAAKNNYFNNVIPDEKLKWNTVTDKVAQVDDPNNSPWVNFDGSGYENGLQNRIDTLTQEGRGQKSLQAKNSDAIDYLNSFINDEHGTFTDAIKHNKNLNAAYEYEKTPGKSPPFSEIRNAKSLLSKTIQDNFNKNGLQDFLGAPYAAANAATQAKNQVFHEIFSPGGGLRQSSFSKMIQPNGPFNDATKFVKDYVPTARGDGTQGMEQFTQMLSNPDLARNVLKNNIFGDSFSDSGAGTNMPQFLRKFNNLSNAQQNYLFNPDELQNIQALNVLKDRHPNALTPQGKFSQNMHIGIPALIGAVAGAHAPGMGEIIGGLAGMTGAGLAARALNDSMTNPRVANYFKKYLLAPKTNSALPLGGRRLTQGVNALLAPQVIGQS